MNYQIIQSENFKVRLKEIIIYVTIHFSRFAANSYLNYLENQVKNLKVLPRYGKEIILVNGIRCRCLVSKKNIILYEVNEEKKEIKLINIVSSNENYLNLL